MEESPSASVVEDDGSAQLCLTLGAPDGSHYRASGISPDMLVSDLTVVFMEMTGDRIPGPSPIDGLRGVVSQPLLVFLDDPETGLIVLHPDEILRNLRIRDGAVFRLSHRVEPGGIHTPDILAFISTAVASGIAGNAAYDFLKAALNRVRARWSQSGSRSLYRDEAVELTRGSLCLKFDIDEPERLQVVSAEPVTAEITDQTLQRLQPIKRAGRRQADYWRCVYSLQEEGLPPSIAVLIGIPDGTYDPDSG
ncbi:MAG TPA: hypothetical protein VKU60_02335, partial [Chloroflexota bacterium]|nr:hypothetical protein [Chloroflexota bacterium]